MQKIDYQEYIKYFQDLKLGVQKGCKFLRELEPRIENLKSLKKTKHKYYNPDTKNLWYFEESKIPQIRKIIQNLSIKFILDNPDQLYTYGNYMAILLEKNFSPTWYVDYMLGLVETEREKKIKLLGKLIITALITKTTISIKEFVVLVGSQIVEYCLVFCEVEIKDFRLLEHLKKVKQDPLYCDYEFYLLIVSELITVLELNQGKNYLFKSQLQDKLNDLRMPKVFSSGKTKYKVCLKSYYLFLLDLDTNRINIDSLKLEKYYQGLDITRIKKLCLRTRLLNEWERINYYLCDFLGTKKYCDDIDAENIPNELLGLLSKELRKLQPYRIFLQEKIYRNLVLSCFSDFELCNENFGFKKDKFFSKKDKFFSKKDKWIKKVKYKI